MIIGPKRATPSQEQMSIFNENPSTVSGVKVATVFAIATTALFFVGGRISPFVFASTTIAIGVGLYQMKNVWQTKGFEAAASCAFTEKRPSETKKEISKAFEILAAQKESKSWNWNGSDSYKILYINECLLIQDVIEKAPAGQKNFYVVDLGAGDFQLARKIADYIKRNTNLLKEGQKVYVISVRGEQNKEESIIDEGKVVRYNLGQFKIEDMHEAFNKRGFFLVNKADLVFSNMTFRHFVDPLGSLAQTYELLKPGKGLLLMDRFFPANELDISFPSDNELNMRIKNILTKLQVPVLLNYDPDDYTTTQFALKRPDSKPFPLQGEYLEILQLAKENSSSAATRMARFKLTFQEVPDLEHVFSMPGLNLYGDEEMKRRLLPVIEKSRGIIRK